MVVQNFHNLKFVGLESSYSFAPTINLVRDCEIPTALKGILEDNFGISICAASDKTSIIQYAVGLLLNVVDLSHQPIIWGGTVPSLLR